MTSIRPSLAADLVYYLVSRRERVIGSSVLTTPIYHEDP
jgi:hypothetical protein